MAEYRVGQGFDVHRLIAGRKLIVGGIEIPYEKGLEGHSDADVLLHAIMDALLGAAGLPDIGHYFPPSDPKFKDADSSRLLVEVKKLVAEAGHNRIINMDCVIMAERPKMIEHIPQMKQRIADVLGIEISRIGIKATTTETLGAVGRGEGIAASAVCLLSLDG